MTFANRATPNHLSNAILSAGACMAAVLILGGCSSTIPVTSSPTGAQAFAGGKPLGATPTQMQPADSKNAVPVEFRLEGYFTESVDFQPGTNQTVISAKLEPATLAKVFSVDSDPEGAAASIDGAVIGTTPVKGQKVVFARDKKDAPWKSQSLVISKANYQSETIELTPSVPAMQSASLGLLREDRAYTITAANTDGAELAANVSVNGQQVQGTTPMKLPITFQRGDKTAPWPVFNVSVEVPAKYKAATISLDFPSSTTVALKLDPVVEITTGYYSPTLVMEPTGVAMKVLKTDALAVLSARDTAEIISSLKPVTNFARQDLKEMAATRSDSINSFCVSPDGQNVIFGLTEHDEHGAYFSNLFIKRADDSEGGIARLTQGSRYLDTLPYIANDGSNYLVFVSNRSDRTKTDIYRVSLVNNRLNGGISRLTNDNRFNFGPSYGDSNRQLFYVSTEPNFPTAETTISSVRMDGSLPTQMSISALELSNAFADKVVFVRVDAETKKKQIYSITADGKLETALVNQEEFRRSNCFNPAVSPDGSRVLFASDSGADEQGRANNDIYMINFDGSGLKRLTQNGSDDIMPAWSPSEEGVVYFLSNRGGAYNIWRMKITTGTKAH
jgi:hypothetical protein